MSNALDSFWNNRNGSTPLEYAVIASLIALSLYLGLLALAPSIHDLYAGIDTALNAKH